MFLGNLRNFRITYSYGYGFSKSIDTNHDDKTKQIQVVELHFFLMVATLDMQVMEDMVATVLGTRCSGCGGSGCSGCSDWM